MPGGDARKCRPQRRIERCRRAAGALAEIEAHAALLLYAGDASKKLGVQPIQASRRSSCIVPVNDPDVSDVLPSE